jgi:hypothetical protein
MKKAVMAMGSILIIALCSCQEQVAERDNSLPEVQPDSFVAFPAPADSTHDANATVEAITGKPASATAYNPEHGQPEHRCDIAVGAPLNTPAADGATVPASPSPLISSPDGMDGNVTLNPPHGQPGHDCAIPVGQPLKG